MAVEQPLGLTLEIMRLRAFARTWQDSKRPLGENEEVPTGPLVDLVKRIRDKRDTTTGAYADAQALADLRALQGT